MIAYRPRCVLQYFSLFGVGSALATGSVAVGAAVNSEISASVALFLWLLIDWVRLGRPGLVGLCVGAIAGLATITPAAGFIQPWGANRICTSTLSVPFC